MNKAHIIIIGFKSVGKSTIAALLADRLACDLIDLDREIEIAENNLNCREIVEQKGEDYFREIEAQKLAELIERPAAVIALGGGAVLNLKNRELIKNHIIVHVTAAKNTVYERILAGGRPAYYNHESPLKDVFNELWEARQKIYKELATITVENKDLNSTVDEIALKIRGTKIELKNILLLHGPNLNLLGLRDSKHYGSGTLADLEIYVQNLAKDKGYRVNHYQSNSEGDLIDILQSESSFHAGIIINPGALSHYSYALHDALLDTKIPSVEVHLSNLEERENWRQHSVTAAACIAKIHGKKWEGYREALELLVECLQHETKK